jgi:anti-sigma B factor antagonist
VFAAWIQDLEASIFMATDIIQEREVGEITILALDRRLKGSLESLLKERIDALVRKGRLQIVVDLKQVPYVDSSEIGRLIRAHISVRQAGGRVRLCNLSEKVSAVLRIGKLDTVLDLYETEEAALASILESETQKNLSTREE